MSLRTRLAKLLWQWSVKLVPLPEPDKPYETLEQALDASKGAVVEESKTPQQWAPKQSGNVIIAEPILMTKHRRGDV